MRAIRSARPELWRFECRRPGADANPYLVLAAIAASAADGITARSDPTPTHRQATRTRSTSRSFQASLEAALRAFEDDAALREALGKDFSDYYATSRTWELEGLARTVTEWERER